VTTAGLGLITSEYYNDFATDTDVTTAIAEIDAAITEFDRLSGSIVADASLLEGRIDLADKKISVLRHEQRNIRAEEFDASAAETSAANLKLRLAINNIESLAQVNNGLIENMLSLSSGPAKGFGVFGMLGY
jgi:flagellin-like hook-associated protein FlgL